MFWSLLIGTNGHVMQLIITHCLFHVELKFVVNVMKTALAEISSTGYFYNISVFFKRETKCN